MSEMETVESLFKDLGTENPKIFSLEQIQTFTSKFSRSLGSGGFGDVYEGILHNGVQVAVKVLKGEALSDGIKEQFKAEVGVLCRTHHRNLVRLYGFCVDPNMIALVYEFMENKSLDTMLYGNQRMEWETICNIAIGTANGLSYLHMDCQPRIIHYDIKPSNILLDSKFTPKVGDFGLAKRLNQDKSYITESRFRGTPMYVAPELLMPYSSITHKCDVYSYGITLFDLIGRKKHLVAEGQNWFPFRVWKQFEEEQKDVIMEECGIVEKDREQATRILLIALKCVQFLPDDRPSMNQVLRLLESKEEVEMSRNPFLYLSSSSSAKSETSTPKVHLASSSSTKSKSLTPKVELVIKQQEKEQKNNEAPLYIDIKVARNEDLVEQIGRDVYCDLVKFDKVPVFHIKKSSPFSILKEEVVKEFAIQVQFQRYWLCWRRSNGTCRPNQLLTLEEEAQSVEEVRQIYGSDGKLKLFLEVERGPVMVVCTKNAFLKIFMNLPVLLNSFIFLTALISIMPVQHLRPILPPKISETDVLIFIKCYDPSREELRHVGMLFVDKKSRPSHMLSKLNIMAGFDPTEPIKLFKESSFSPFLCNSIDIWMTFEDEEFTNGDIICFQKSPPVKNKPKQIFDFSHLFKQQHQYRYPDVPHFLSSKAGEAIWYASRQTRDGNHLLSPVSSSEFDASALKK